MPPLIVTLALDAEAQAWFDAMRKVHYPPERNLIGAHVTLFHALPQSDETLDAVRTLAARYRAFAVRVTDVHSLGKGVAYTLKADKLRSIHAELTQAFTKDLTPQDRQGFRPHVVVQNKVTAEAARVLLARLSAEFEPWACRAEGLEVWEYLGGPWRPVERVAFGSGG